MSIYKSTEKNVRGQGGFSLVEIAVLVIVAGFIMVPLYNMMYEVSRLGPTDRRFDIIRAALAEHVRVYGYYPCPATLTDGPGDAQYDRGAAAGSGCTGTFINAGVSIGAVPVEPLTLVMGCSKTTAGDELDASVAQLLRNQMASIGDRIREGVGLDSGMDAEDYNTRNLNQRLQKENCITQDHLLDAHGSKIVYAVTIIQTDPSTVDLTSGTAGEILLRDQNDNTFSNEPDFVLVSVGEDKKGGYNQDGSLSGVACDRIAAAKDIQNCDYTLGAPNRIFRIMPQSMAETNEFYDDYVDFSLDGAISENDFWYNMADADDVMFNPRGRVVIESVEDPSEADEDDKLIVNQGNMQGSSLSAQGNVMGQAQLNSSGVISARQAVRGNAFCYDSDCDGI